MASSRTELLARYEALPFPTTSDEAWRFTDLRDFDPGSFGQNGHRGQTPVSTPAVSHGTMVDIDVAGVATVSEDGIEIERAPDGITFEPLGDHERLGTLVGADEKFAAHNAAVWKHGLLVHVPKGVELEQPLYVRLAAQAPSSSFFWRLLVVAEEGSRFSLI